MGDLYPCQCVCVWRIRAADEKHRRERSEGSASLSRLYHTVLGGRRGSEIAPCPALPDLHLAHLLHSYRRLVPILAVLRGHGTNGVRGASDKSREGHGPACLDAREVQRDLCEPRAPTQGHSKRAPRCRTAHKSAPPPTPPLFPGQMAGEGEQWERLHQHLLLHGRVMVLRRMRCWLIALHSHL